MLMTIHSVWAQQTGWVCVCVTVSNQILFVTCTKYNREMFTSKPLKVTIKEQ
jgi:hypothetical protein